VTALGHERRARPCSHQDGAPCPSVLLL